MKPNSNKKITTKTHMTNLLQIKINKNENKKINLIQNMNKNYDSI